MVIKHYEVVPLFRLLYLSFKGALYDSISQQEKLNHEN